MFPVAAPVSLCPSNFFLLCVLLAFVHELSLFFFLFFFISCIIFSPLDRPDSIFSSRLAVLSTLLHIATSKLCSVCVPVSMVPVGSFPRRIASPSL